MQPKHPQDLFQRSSPWRDEIDHNALMAKQKERERTFKRAEANLSESLRNYIRKPEGEIFAAMLRRVIATRTYYAGESDLGAVAFSEGYRAFAMEIADLCGMNILEGELSDD